MYRLILLLAFYGSFVSSQVTTASPVTYTYDVEMYTDSACTIVRTPLQSNIPSGTAVFDIGNFYRLFVICNALDSINYRIPTFATNNTELISDFGYSVGISPCTSAPPGFDSSNQPLAAAFYFIAECHPFIATTTTTTTALPTTTTTTSTATTTTTTAPATTTTTTSPATTTTHAATTTTAMPVVCSSSSSFTQTDWILTGLVVFFGLSTFGLLYLTCFKHRGYNPLNQTPGTQDQGIF